MSAQSWSLVWNSSGDTAAALMRAWTVESAREIASETTDRYGSAEILFRAASEVDASRTWHSDASHVLNCICAVERSMAPDCDGRIAHSTRLRTDRQAPGSVTMMSSGACEAKVLRLVQETVRQPHTAPSTAYALMLRLFGGGSPWDGELICARRERFVFI